MRKSKIVQWLQYLIGGVLLIMSLWFIINPNSSESFRKFQQPEYVRHILGWIEALVSLLFIINRTKFFGGIGLLLVFAFATYLHINVGLTAYGLIPWAVGIIFCLTFDYITNKK